MHASSPAIADAERYCWYDVKQPAKIGLAKPAVDLIRLGLAERASNGSTRAGTPMSVIAPQPVSRSRWMQVGWAFMLLGALLAAANALLFMNIDGYGHPGIKSRFLATGIAGWMPTLGGASAVMLGPWQFLSRVRARYSRVHVWTGRAYLLAVLSGALGGLYFAPMSVGGNPLSSASAFWPCSGCTPGRRHMFPFAAGTSSRIGAG